MTTIDDVARLAGVSTATVSRALRGLPTVSETTRIRVLLAAEQLDYTASPSASRLAGGKTGTVAVIVPRITPWFVGAVVEAAEEILQHAGYDLLLYNIGGREHARQRLLHKANLPKRVDAVMLVATPIRADDLATIASLALPGVTVSSGTVVPGWPSIRVDDRAAGRTATEHLLDLGHRRIACVWGDPADEFAHPAQLERQRGYQDALLAVGLRPDPRLRVETRADAEGGRAATERLIAGGELPTAIFASCDELAMGVVSALRLAGLRVPQEVSVIGIDDHDLAGAFGLTTVAQPAAEQGQLAAGALLGPLAGRPRPDDEPAPVILPTRLVVRDSTGPPRGRLNLAGPAPYRRSRPPFRDRWENVLNTTGTMSSAATSSGGPSADPAVADTRPADTGSGPWWRHAVIYQIYPRSFADSDGDGIGDLPGITARLDHLVELGVDAVWLSPFYPSPQADAGYDVADYRDVDPLFGTLADADRLFAEARARGLRVIVDLVPNHTSSAHPWFTAALAAAPGSPERQRYVFRDGRGPAGAEPPNDWPSVFGGPAWTRVTEPDGTPGQWYLHLFDTGQPDLNWDNPEVRAEFLDILRYWLDRGVDGFRVDVANGLVKQADLADWHPPVEPSSGEGTEGPRPPMWDQDGVHLIYQDWRRVLDEYPGERILVAEAWVQSAERLAAYVRPDEMHQAFNFEYLEAAWTAPAQYAVITRSLAANEAVGAPTTWVLSNHDVLRHASRLGLPVGTPRPRGIGVDDPQPDAVVGLRRARAATLLMLSLPGSAYLYQGEELGLPEHTTLPDEARQDPTWQRSGHTERGRDGCRVPIPWEADAPSYGFGPGDASWLPQPALWAEYALDRQRAVAGSTYELYRTSLRLRRELRLGAGTVYWLTSPDNVLYFRNGGLRVLTNFGADPVDLPDGAELVHASGPLDADGRVPTDVTVWLRGEE